MALAVNVKLEDWHTLDVFGNELPPWLKEDMKKQPRSQTVTSTTFRLRGSNEEISIPIHTCSTVYEVKSVIATKLGIDPGILQFIVKQGCSFRKQKDIEECGRQVMVGGIRSFTRAKHQWPCPLAIIGAGHAGLRQAMFFLKHRETNFVVYDRHATVGGMAWHDQANTTTKLQTELGTYHLQYDEDNPVPKNMKTWPSRDDLLKHFQEVSDEYGITPYVKFQTNVKQLNIINHEKDRGASRPPGQFWADQTYRFTLQDLAAATNLQNNGQSEVDHSALCMYPGNLSVPRREEYQGEDVFDGPIEYGIQNTFDYSKVAGKAVTIVGHGAFAVENIRSCAEYNASKIYLVCRRRNLACPRMASWMVNQSNAFLSGRLYMDVTAPMYDLIGFDPWSYHSVFSNEKRTNVTITQKARFGIGDVYFLTIAMGVTEVVDGAVKRLTKQCVHLDDSSQLECSSILKLLGFVGSWENDRVLCLKEMNGFWVNGDFRRLCIAEPIGVNASNFGGTSFSPGVRGWVNTHAHFMWYPKDFGALLESNALGKHQPDPDQDRPGYVIDARFATTCSMMVGGIVRNLGEQLDATNTLKRDKQLLLHPPAKILAEAAAEWDEYAQRFKANGAPKPPPPYPYTMPLIQGFLKRELKEFEQMMSR